MPYEAVDIDLQLNMMSDIVSETLCLRLGNDAPVQHMRLLSGCMCSAALCLSYIDLNLPKCFTPLKNLKILNHPRGWPCMPEGLPVKILSISKRVIAYPNDCIDICLRRSM